MIEAFDRYTEALETCQHLKDAGLNDDDIQRLADLVLTRLKEEFVTWKMIQGMSEAEALRLLDEKITEGRKTFRKIHSVKGEA